MAAQESEDRGGRLLASARASRTLWRLRALAIGLILAIVLVLLSGSFYTVDEY
jgi:hypothetical protein